MLRLEHWTNAAEQASAVAANILDGAAAARYDPVPYVWSDQYGRKFQILGSVSGEDDVTLVQGELGGRRFAAAYSRGGRIRGLVACDLPQQVAAMRPLIAASAPLAQAI